MTPIFLHQLDIRGFRVFRDKFSVQLPGPGVALLVGQNGLGKTSLFDAIEWGLTGLVHRLKELPSEAFHSPDLDEYLANRGTTEAPARAFSVALRFGEVDGSTSIIRRARKRQGEKWKTDGPDPTDEDIVHKLKSQGWQLPITNPAEYLRQTHFMCQSAAIRPAAQKKEDRWRAFKGPAAFDRLDAAQRSLGTATTAALKRRVDAASALLEERQRAVAEFDKDASIYERWLSERQVHGALSPEQAREEWRLLATHALEVARTLESLPFKVIKVHAAGMKDIPSAETVNHLEQMVAAFSGALDAASHLPTRWAQLQGERTALMRSTQNLETDRAEIGRRRQTIEAEAATIKEAIHAQGIALAAASEELAQLERFARANHDAKTAGVRLRETIAAAAAVQQQLQVAEGELNRGRSAYQESVIQETARTSAATTLEAAEKLLARAIELVAQRDTLQPQQGQLASLRHELNRANQALGTLEADILSRSERIRSAEARIESVRAQRGAIRRAAAEIAAALREQDDRCPVCNTEFAEGRLRQVANELSSRRDPILAAAEAALADEREALVEVQRRRDAVRQQVAEQAATVDATQRAQTTLELEESALRSDAHCGELDVNEIVSQLEGRTRQLRENLTEIVSRIQMRPPQSELLAALSQLEQRHGEFEFRLHAAEEQVARYTALQKLSDATLLELTSVRERWSLGDEEPLVLIAERRQRLQEAQTRIHADRERSDELAIQLKSLINEEDNLAERIETRAARRVTIDQELQNTLQAWLAVGFSAVPNDADLQSAMQHRRQAEGALPAIRGRRTQIIEGANRWLKSEDAASLRARLGIEGEAPSETDADALRQRREALETAQLDAERALRTAESARKMVSDLSKELADATAGYAKSVVEPFNELTRRFGLAISTFPERDVRYTPTTNKHGTSLAMHVGPQGSTSKEYLSANHYLSEGQVAAASLSMLLAMSTAYRWSRWRGLLLDDPLQQCDITHAAALADLLGNLVNDQKYQVILSTHDFSLGSYLQRKFASRRVPVAMITFVHPGRTVGDDALPPQAFGIVQDRD